MLVGLRATRYALPGSARVHSDRRVTYVAALHQAEDLFSADKAGPASSPLLLFYGLSQAGHAIAAASTVLQADDWHSAVVQGRRRRRVTDTLISVTTDILGLFTPLAVFARAALPSCAPA
jgi:hypothetical protein